MKYLSNFFNDVRNKHVYIYRGSLAFAAAFIILLLYPTNISFNYEYYAGSPWQHEDLLAPFDFAIQKSDLELEEETKEINGLIIPVYSKDYSLEEKMLAQFDDNWIEGIGTLMKEESASDYLEEMRIQSRTILREIYNEGILLLNNDLGKASQDGFIFIELNDGGVEKPATDFLTLIDAFNRFHNLELDSSAIDVLRYEKLIEASLDYNILFNESKTELLFEDARASISLNKGKVDKGTIVIERGEIVSNEKIQMLDSLKNQYNTKLGSSQDVWFLVLSNLIFILIILWLTYRYISRFIPSIIFSPAGWTFILLIYILVVALVKVSVYDNGLSQYLVPMMIFPIIIRAFFELRLALFIHIINVLLTAGLVPNPYEFVLLQIVAGLVVLFSLKNLRRRSQFFLTALLIFLAYSLIFLSLEIYKVGDIMQIDVSAFRFFAFNAGLTLFAYPLIYLFEKLFGFISDVTLIEMTDMNNQLLRDLADKAPGTFQHSLQVANMAEAAIHKIGGHELLVRVGALYHDIGKMKNPMFFIENQTHGINPHDELSFDESAQLIIQHVLDGITMAKKSNLPDQIVDFIRTHHGTTRVEYFYRSMKAESLDEDINESTFTYPGPKPYSKETAVLMMADGVEAASRSMKEINSESIEKLVHSIIDSLIIKEQFINANITFKDISVIKKIFIKMLTNVYHVRIEYPKG